MRLLVYVPRVATGLTAPVATYMVLALFIPVGDARLIFLAGSAWCLLVWACYFVGMHIHDARHPPPG